MSKKYPHKSGNPAVRSSAQHRVTQGVPAAITWKDWVGGARLRTLPLAVAPVAAGAGIAHMLHGFSLALTLLALGVAIFLQIGVNFANDYSDGIRGTDEHRVGPARLTASGQVKPRRVFATAMTFFALAALAGLVAVIMSERWWFLAVGLLAILAAWFYTGGKKPYGYAGLGELFVFIFFGLVATMGTVWLQTDVWADETWVSAIGVGLFAVAVLVANNVRDIPTDRLAGKRTLAVRLGKTGSKVFYTLCVVVPFAIPAIYGVVHTNLVLTWFTLLLVLPAIAIMWFEKSAKELILVLVLTSYAGLVYGALLGVGFAF